jgi:hypothetical protein
MMLNLALVLGTLYSSVLRLAIAATRSRIDTLSCVNTEYGVQVYLLYCSRPFNGTTRSVHSDILVQTLVQSAVHRNFQSW